jgi:hypothetical protein
MKKLSWFNRIGHSLAISLSCLGALAFSQNSHATVFRNSYLSFELPEKWDCQLRVTAFVCKTTNSAIDHREAIIILTAKEAGPSDTNAAYEQYLKTPRTTASRTGQPLLSQVQKTENHLIGTQTWVDSLHLSSEVPNYYTRYLATTKDRLGILVTFSAHKNFFTKYSADFSKAIESLRVTVSRNQLSGSGNGAVLPGSEIMGSSGLNAGTMQSEFASAEDELAEGGNQAGSSSNLGKFLGIGLAVAAVAVYLVLKRRGSM